MAGHLMMLLIDGSGELVPPVLPLATPASFRQVSCDDGEVGLEWDAVDGANNYEIQLADSVSPPNWGFPDDIVILPVTPKAQINIGQYFAETLYARIRAVSSDRPSSPFAGPLALDCSYAPPAGLSQSSCSDGFVTLTWSAARDAIGYELQYSQTIDSEYTTYTRNDAGTSEASIENAAIAPDADGEVYWRVRALYADDQVGEYSTSVLVTCPYDQP
jgi:hypothetical protein